MGWGGLASAFPNPETGKFKEGWQQKGEQLRDLLTPREYRAASRSTRNAHYTSSTVVKAMWGIAQRLGFRGGMALESSMGVGNFLGLMPDNLNAKFIGVEYDSLTARIAGALYPQATVLESGFQDVPLPDNVFSLAIGNPPFGDESLRFQFKPELRGASIHNQFFRASMDSLKPDGLLVQVVSRYLLDAQDKSTRVALARQGELVAAFRLPDTAFKENARTVVVTDVIVMRKRDAADQARMNQILDAYSAPKGKIPDKERERRDLASQAPSWIETAEVKDPLGGEPMVVNRYFADNPGNVIGVLERSGSMRYKNDVTVRLDDPASLGARLDALVARLPENIVNSSAAIDANTAQAYKVLGESLRLAVAKEESGHVKIDADGKMVRVVEREFGNDTVLTTQELTPASPWSKQLNLDSEGRWYKIEVKLDEKGDPVKVVKDGKPTKNNVYERTVYPTEADVPVTARLGEAGFTKLKAMVGLRDLLKRQLTLETDDSPRAMMEGNRAKLAKAYEDFVATNGPVNRRSNRALVEEMPDGALVLALEESYEPERTAKQAEKSGLPVQPEVAKPAPILRERVVPKYEPATKAETAADALAITMAERGVVDVERIAQLLGISPEDAVAKLQDGDKPLVFQDPETNTYETANAYLSGQVKRKLLAAQAAGLAKNVKALQEIQPERWGAENVSVQLGASWVPADVYADFATHLFGGNATASFSQLTNTFALNVKGADSVKMDAWSSEKASGDWILGRMLNSQTPTITYTDENGSVKVDKERTSLAMLKTREITAEFGDWIFKDAERRERLVDVFNEKFNTRVTRQYDGSHLKLPGKVPDSILKMRRHQMNAIWRGISSRFLLIDHVVGAGKTFTAISRAMERRRMGLAQKPTIVVPNHLVEQWQLDVYRLYPGAKVLAASKEDFTTKRRRKLFGRIATGDYDVVILPHSSFGMIGIAPETEMRFLEQEMKEAIAAVAEAEEQAREDGYEGFRKPMGVKEAERLVSKIEARMAKLREGVRDRLLTFEQLGIDDLTIDEAHEFKNLYYSSRMTNTRGMGNKVGSRKAADLYNKVRVMRETNGSVTFMTGTPVSNSVVELYTMMRYLAADELRDLGMEHFDAWRTQFVDASPAFEPTESGTLKEVNRLGRTWSNMRSMMDLYYQFTDAVSIDDIKKWYAEDNNGERFPVPALKGGDRQLVKVAPTQAQESLLREVIAGFEGLDGIKDIKERNAERLRLMDRARKLSLDVRAVDARNQSKEQGGKLEKLSAEVKRIYDKTSKVRGTQLVFLDRSVPKSKGDDKIIKEYDALVAKRDAALAQDDDEAFQDVNEKLEKYDANEIESLRNAQSGGWNAYQQIKDNLVASGIPAAEIRFVQEATTDEQKQALFDAVNGGKVRVLLGSTPRMGAGTNVQQRLVALHHADVTWKPSDIEQREGRIIRQGNLFATPPTKNKPNPLYDPTFEAEILAYATERTVDAKMWSLNATKLRAINGLRKYTGDFTMEVDDEESVSMAEMAALASGNPLLLERVTLESAINGLELQERAFRRKMYGIQDAVDSAKKIIKNYPAQIESARKTAKALAGRVQAVADKADKRRVTVEGVETASYKEALQAAEAARVAQQEGNDNARYAINVNGQRLTNKAGIEDAIGAALGDSQPFEVTLGGTDFTQRTAAGRELSAILSPKAAEGVKEQVSGVAGSMFSLDLRYQFTASRYDSSKVDLLLTLEGDGIVAASAEIGSHDPMIAFTTAQLRDWLGKMASEVENRSTGDSADYMERRLEEARRDLPTYQERAKEGFPKAQELKDKRARLQEVVGQLTGPAPTAAIDQEGDEPVNFSRLPPVPNGKGQRAAQTKAAADAITKAWKNGPEIIVVRDMQDPDVPETVRKYDEQQRSLGADGTPEGFYFKGKVYVVASMMRNANDVARVVFHEALGHFGLQNAFGSALKPILKQVATMRAAEVKAKAESYGLDVTVERQMLLAAEEVLAEMAQTRPEIGFVRRAIAAIRTWLRQNVPAFNNLRMTDDELVPNFILPAREFVERSRKADLDQLAGNLVPAFSRSAMNSVEANIKRGTAAMNKAILEKADANRAMFRPGIGWVDFVWGDGKKGLQHIISRRQQSDGMTVDQATRFLTGKVVDVIATGKELRRTEVGGSVRLALGLGGAEVSLVRRAGSNGWVLTAFELEPDSSARSATQSPDTQNTPIRSRRELGAGKPILSDDLGAVNSDAEPLFARATGAKDVDALKAKATDALNDLFNVPGKLNWWQKTVGTMYDLAERNPEFKRVFDAGQAFINDVSAYATQAANLAPRILPKLETWRDIGKSPLSAADTKAIAAPIFEGTLLWARDESGKLIRFDELQARYALMTDDQKAQVLLRLGKVTEAELKRWQATPLPIYEGAVRNRFDREFGQPGVVFSDAELRNQFKLSDEQIDLYREFRAATDKSLNDLAVSDMLRFGGKDVAEVRELVKGMDADAAGLALADHLREKARAEPDRASLLLDTSNKMIEKADRVAELVDRGYAPLTRFGQYTLDVVDEKGERVYFGLFESRMEAGAMARKMKANFPGAQITQGTMSQQSYKLFAGVSPETLELFGQMLGLEGAGSDPQSQAFQQYLKLAKSNRSALKRLIERKGIAGFSEDAGRVLAGFVYSNARQTASNLHLGEMTEAANAIPQQQGEMKDVAIKLADYIKNPQEEAQAVRGLLFAQYLGGSIASAMVNLTQPIAVTTPYLSQFGGATKAGRRVAAALKDALKPTTGDKALDAALAKAEAEGIVAPQEVHQLLGQAQGRGSLKSGDGTRAGDAAAKASNALSKLSLAWGKLFGVAEQYNRRSTFIAAYRTAVEEGLGDPAAFAERAIAQTQFVYNKGNRPQWARGAIGATLFTFKQYSVSYMELLTRMATAGEPGSPERTAGRKAALLAVGLLFLMGGAGGLPFAEDAEDVVDGVLQRLGYNFSTKRAKKEFLTNVFGQGGAHFIENGISGLPGVPIDVSGRLGLGNLVPGTGLFTTKSDYTRDVAELAGPAGDLAKRAFQGVSKLASGEVLGANGALATVAPVAATNLYKGYDMATTGIYKDSKGKKVLDVDGFDAAMKAIGFQPADVSRVQEATGVQQNMIAQNKLQEGKIADMWAQGVAEKDPAKVQRAKDKLAEWNENNPETPIRIQLPQIVKRVRALNEDKATRIAKTAPTEIRASVRRELAEDLPR